MTRQRLYRVRRWNHEGTGEKVRILNQRPAAERLAAKWAAWPSTARVEITTTITPGWEPLP